MTDAQEIDALIEQLSHWEREHGMRFADDPNLESSGESSSAIAELKRRLCERGARFHWVSSARAYVLDAVGEPPGEEGDPS